MFAASILSISISELQDELLISQLNQGKYKIRAWRCMKHTLRSGFIPLDYCLVKQGTRSVSTYAYEFEQFYGCNYYYEPKENTVTRFIKGLNLHIQERMPTYIIYNLQHAIHLAKQIESQIESQQQRNFDDVIKKLDEVQNLIKE